jgi:glycosyltransferase involved in cell wall biosynthesis
VLNQTYRQLEVILIDDCSPDDSMSVAQDVIRNSPDSADLLSSLFAMK